MTKTLKTILGLILAWALVAQAGTIVAQTPVITSMHTAATTTANGTALVVNGPAGNPANTIGAAGIQISNSAGTFTITFEALTSGSTWTAVMATNMTDDTRATTATAAGQYTVLLGGAVQLRARISACSSCSVTVVGRLVPGLVARVASSGGGGGSGTVNTGAAGALAYYPSSGTTVDDTPALVYSASADQTLKATPASGKTGMVVYEPGSAPPATIQSAPALQHLHVTNAATYWALGYTSDATAVQWANYLNDDGSLIFYGWDNGAGGGFDISFSPTTDRGDLYFYPKGFKFFSSSPTYFGGMAETGSDVFGLMVTTDTPTSGALFPLRWSNSYVDHPPFGASAGNTTEHRYLELAANGTNYVGFKAPDAITANKIWTLPSADGTSGQVLQTNGSGTLSWATAGGSTNTSAFTKTSNTTLANITGLSHNVEAGRTYSFYAQVDTTAAATGGVKFAVSGTATATSINYSGVLIDGTTIIANTRATALNTTVCASTISTAGSCIIKGTIVVNTAGTLTLQMAQNASDAGASTVLINQYMQLIPIS